MPSTAVRSVIPWGEQGSRVTLQKMRQIVNSAIMEPRTVGVAHSIIRFCPPRAQHAMATEIRNWMSQHFHFVNDPVGVELVRTPEFMLRQLETNGWISGDCDDAAVLGAALGKAVGIPARFCAVAFSVNGTLRHVYAELMPRGGNVVTLDVTRPAGVVAVARRHVRIVV